ncbi:DUF3267 domain-containing protein [Halogeometricum sp. S1BR25-6]|uniref:DUF3267 domain-containing protein n=1 Tax=Halogeometricum salsisoli TaxID=2950536 RepID=A0ABU2GGK1_9EURY|nr:DUF3267 domain-containing protein [Halogeometricum sp. S1BR25-6]MDS0299556.1 DUF3267 domain-containing protein [Halogeometricum sp. S1BR25-6]
MPESEYDPDDALVPSTPAGYRDPTTFDYSMPALAVVGTALTVLGIFAFGAVLDFAQGSDVYDALFVFEELPDGGFVATLRAGLVFGITVAVVVVTVVAHELVHGIVYRRFGYDVSYGLVPSLGAAYAGAFHQFQRSEHVRYVGVAPLLVLDALFLILLFVPVPFVAFAAFVGLVFNTAGAAGDLYLLWFLSQLPEGTLLYDSDMRHSYVFKPASKSDSNSSSNAEP